MTRYREEASVPLTSEAAYGLLISLRAELEATELALKKSGFWDHGNVVYGCRLALASPIAALAINSRSLPMKSAAPKEEP